MPDLNVLLYAVNADAAQQAVAARWLEEAHEQPGGIGYAWVVLLGFLRIATRPGIFPRPLTLDEALGQVDDWLSHPRARILAPTERHAAVLAQTFERWIQLRAPFVGKLPAPGAFIDQRLGALHKALIAAGAHPHQLSDMLPLLQGDAQGLAELALVGREALWQLQAIVHAVQRRWPQLGERTTAADAACADWCTACEQGLGGSAASQIGL